MTQCRLPAGLELGTHNTKYPQGKGHLPAVPGCPQCSASLIKLFSPKAAHFLRVFEEDYSRVEGKKGEFVMLNLSSLNFLRSCNIFILTRKTQLYRFSALSLGRIWNRCLPGWFTAGCSMDKMFLDLIRCFGIYIKLFPKGSCSS